MLYISLMLKLQPTQEPSNQSDVWCHLLKWCHPSSVTWLAFRTGLAHTFSSFSCFNFLQVDSFLYLLQFSNIMTHTEKKNFGRSARWLVHLAVLNRFVPNVDDNTDWQWVTVVFLMISKRHPFVWQLRPRTLVHRDIQYLLTLARHKPTLFLDEYADRLADGRFLTVSMSTIHRAFARAGLNVKHIQKLAAKRNPTIRADFVRRIAQYPTEYLVCLDEVSKDDWTYARLWGRSRVGTRVEQHDPFVRKRRLSMVAALALDEGIVAAKVVEDSFHRETFMEYLHDDVVSAIIIIFYILVDILWKTQLPMTNPYPGARSVIVMDNARIHHAQEIEDLIYSYGEFDIMVVLSAPLM